MDDATHHIPIIRLWDVLLVPLQGDVSDAQVASLVDAVLRRIRDDGGRGLALDLSGLSIVDSHLCAAFAGLASSARLMGVRTILCGLSPEIAMTLQAMDIELRGVDVALSLERALAQLGVRGGGVEAERAEARALVDEMMGWGDETHDAGEEGT